MNASQEKDQWAGVEKCERFLPIPSPAFLGSVVEPVTLAVPKQLPLSSQPVTLGRQTPIDLERISPKFLVPVFMLVPVLFQMFHHLFSPFFSQKHNVFEGLYGHVLKTACFSNSAFSGSIF